MASARTAAFAGPYLFAMLIALAGVASTDRLPQGRRLRAVALVDVSSENAAKAKASASGSKVDSQLPSGWFGDFSQDESTFTTEGLDASKEDPEYAVKYGRDPSLEQPYQDFEVLPSKFFHESESGGPKAAWQTNYPSLSASVAGNRVAPNPWKQTPSGWVNEYQTTLDGGAVQPSNPDWFDNSIHQIDGFGRKMPPGVNDGRRYIDASWLERSVNTTITCKEIGCTARSSLQLYDTSKEEAKLCRLSLDIHPTDYDDDWSREHVEFWKVNGYVANRECNPRTRGCNATAERPLYPCVNGLDVDKLIDSKGTLVLEGKNTQMVDECPTAEGNLLSAVAMATCMVRNKVNDTATTPTTTLFTMVDLLGEGVIKCDKPGCTAETVVHISPAIALNGGKCTMNITVHQTDYDDALGLPEQIDFLQVEGTNVTDKPVSPGKNPCSAAYKGTNLTEQDKIFNAVENKDITDLVTKSKFLGMLHVKGKISDQVDECGFEGNLLHGNVTVRCVPPASFAAVPPPGQAAILHAPTDTPALLANNATVNASKKANLLQRGSVQKHARA